MSGGLSTMHVTRKQNHFDTGFSEKHRLPRFRVGDVLVGTEDVRAAVSEEARDGGDGPRTVLAAHDEASAVGTRAGSVEGIGNSAGRGGRDGLRHGVSSSR
jgi:hypothetical protein